MIRCCTLNIIRIRLENLAFVLIENLAQRLLLQTRENDKSIDISNCIEKKEIVDKLKNLLYH